jgi:hypothetical protein
MEQRTSEQERICARTGPRTIHFVHEGRASYPELKAYRKHLVDRAVAVEVTLKEAQAARSLENSICWHIMGFYPRRLPAAFVIHDYRSLSVGVGRTIKDWLKARLNHRPDLRIYQNDSIRLALGFNDDVPEIFLPMGVPDDILDFRSTDPSDPAGDFCYVGSMLRERRIDRMISSFLRRYGSSKTLWLYGTPDKQLKAAFSDCTNVVFAGLLPQNELFHELSRFRACVCYFPNHHPHLLQTPTKLLEYAALGRRIIANEQPRSRMAAEEFGITCHWGPADDMFAEAPDMLDWPDNGSLDPASLSWSSVIRRSGIDAVLAAED